MVLTPKGNVDTWGIGLLEFIWKVVEAVIDTLIKTAIQFDDVLPGFRAGRGMGTIVMDLKLTQELESVEQELIFMLLINPRKA